MAISFRTLISNTKRPEWWKDRAVELLMSLLVVYLLTNILDQRRESQERLAKELFEAQDWFVVNEIFVPDHVQGSNPLVIYDRDILYDFIGFWVAEVQRRDGSELQAQFFNACTGSGTAPYSTTDTIPPEGVTWHWFLDKPCPVGPGQYRIVVTYDLNIPGYDIKRMTARSNVFTVTAKE